MQSKQNKIEIYKTLTGTEIEIKLEKETVWLDAHLIAALFDVKRPAIVKHINNIYKSGELTKKSTCSILEQVAADGKKRKMNLYNLDMIISVGYRVNSKQATQFRQWATQRLKNYLVQVYAINEKRLQQKNKQVLHLKTGIQILSRAIEEKAAADENDLLKIFSKGLALLDDFDHEELDNKGITKTETIFPSFEEYLSFIAEMYSDLQSEVFAKPKDDSFHSSINQIKQTFDGKELYPSLQEKAANLLYLIVKNHSYRRQQTHCCGLFSLFFREK